MIKVANIIEDGRIAGPQIRILDVAKSLYGNGIDTTVIIPKSNSGELQSRLQQSNVKYKTLPLHRLTKDPLHLFLFVLLFLYELLRLFLFFKKQRFDIVHVSGGAWQFKGVIAGCLAGAKVVWHLNDTSMPNVIMCFFSVISKYFADAFIVAGGAVSKYYHSVIQAQKKPVYEIQAPVDCVKFNPSEVEGLLVGTSDKITVVTVANINPIKGLEYFVGMVGVLNKQYTQVEYYIVGPVYETQKKYFEKLQRLIEKEALCNIHFYGPTADIPGILKSANIYVCSSVAEASPTSVWEAMAMGRSIVSTDVGDVAKFIHDGETGYIVPPESSQMLADRVGKLIDDEGKRISFGNASRKTALDCLAIENVVQAHMNCYSSL